MSELNSNSNQMGGDVELELDDSYNGSAEDIQIALAPYIQNYLSQTRRRHSCCNVMLPVAFERAANKSWLDPKFDSPVLEDQFRTSVFPQIRLRFRFALGYILFCSLIWTIYFLSINETDTPWIIICICLIIITIICIIGLWQTYTNYYKKYINLISVCISILIIITSLLFLIIGFNAFSPLGHFAICIEIIFIIYTVVPLPLWQCGFITITYSIIFELLTIYLKNNYQLIMINYKTMIIRLLLQLSVHLIGIHVLIMNVVRMRGTFMKVGQNLLVRGQLEMEKKLKEKMIHSVMPPKVADLLLKEGGNALDNDNDIKSMFRPFHMHSMNNVSILFADIVGFTKMSSSKTADQLVEILNDLFERFDNLCEMKGCEKISTLGDCYYCVSGCPEPRPDHAICCVEMGLGMITVMQVFDAQRHEGVQIRVGVHTGNVLCGIVGTRRVKFDVWSNDVTLANRMESTGRPEQVHISQETSNFLGDVYILEEGEEIFGHRSFFVMGRKKDSSCASGMDIDYLNNGFNNTDKLSPSPQSTNHPESQQLNVPPTSPIGYSAGPSPILSLRPRLSSLGKMTKYLSSRKTESKILQQPKIIVTAKSLPGSLNSETEDISNERGGEIKLPKIEQINDETKSPKHLSKFKNWKVPKFLRKIDSGNDLKIQIEIEKKVDTTNTVNSVEQNGYFQLPVLIETHHYPSSNNTLTIPNKMNQNFSSLTSSPKEQHDNVCPTLQYTMFDDIIDVKSYISQSRSDISPFGRSGSYRSHSGRSPNEDISPTVRPRSSTIATQQFTDNTNITTHNNNRNNIYLGPSGDRLSICPSVTSRKDSGIRSNSRRSSIQQQLYTLNQTQNRVSGYFTSSQSSLSNNINPIETPTNLPHPDPLAACLQQLRKQSDLQLIKCVRENAESQRNYLVKPPISPISLFFKSRTMELDFRNNAHSFGQQKEKENFPTLATPKYNTFLDIFIGILFYISITASLFLLASTKYKLSYRIWVCLFVTFSFIQFFVLLICSNQIFKTTDNLRVTRFNNTNLRCTENIINAISGWYTWHICGAIVLILPTISVLVNFTLTDIEKLKIYEYHYGFLLFLCIIHFCNFTQLNCWMRNLLATIAAICFIIITIIHNNIIIQENSYLNINNNYENNNNNNNITTNNFYNNNNNLIIETDHKLLLPIIDNLYLFNDTINNNNNNKTIIIGKTIEKKLHDYCTEICIDLILLIILIWFLNREFEIGYRLTFYGSAVANQDKIRVQNMKNQADMLLHNIIPKFVAEQIKNTAKYSENHYNIGIIFASIVNFNELYDESYLGGKEYLRVLNELIGDFDELLSREEYQCVEKIKTIGSTFMAASGLDPSNRREDFTHLYLLIEFAIAMQTVVESFNKDLLEFNLILRIGYNIGDVTAGVIGRSKLYYDIWGDAVNVASRMDSTGLAGRIQFGKACLPFLDSKYNFEPRGKVYVKGKDHMEVYLLNGRKPDLPGDDDLDFVN